MSPQPSTLNPQPLTPTSPWHRESYDAFLNDSLPQLLAERLPLAGYRVETSNQTCAVTVTIRNGNGEISVEFADLPYPAEKGTFQINGQEIIVVPLALHDQLATAEIHCVGEQIHAEIAAQLGAAPDHLPWDAALLTAWLPLTTWVQDYLSERGQVLDTLNWLSEQRHLRAIIIPDAQNLITPGHFGRVCPFETPEGPNIGKVLRISVGAEIRDRRIIITDDSPAAGLGVNASMIPLLEHDDPNRLLMGANMMGQWLVPPAPAPAQLQTGREPNAPNFCCGRNLLTAFISWGSDTYADGLVLSASAAQRLAYPHELEVGDKLSNRHGAKGCVTRILPDAKMPHLSDGTPVDLLYSFSGVPLRMNFGQIREAILGRIAQRAGEPALCPPYDGPAVKDIKTQLAAVGLPADGMEALTIGADGPALERTATVGYVYWGKTAHLSRFKLMADQDVAVPNGRGEGLQRQAELEFQALRGAGAFKVAATVFNQQTSGKPSELPTTLRFATLQDRLAAGGIRADIENDALHFQFATPEGETLTLAQPISHPWLADHELSALGVRPEMSEYGPLVEANARLERLMESQAPESLTANAVDQLETAVHAYVSALVTPADLRFDSRVAYSGRAVIVPGGELQLDQVGLPAEMAWTFFGPQVAEKLGDSAAVEARTPAATAALDEIMAAAWVVINRAPSTSPTAILAFHPVRYEEPTIRIHQLITRWLEADFDGDQVEVYLPLGVEAQEEAAEKLSVVGHLQRDLALIESLSLEKDFIWGLGALALTAAGRAQIQAETGIDLPSPAEANTQIALTALKVELLAAKGIEIALETLEKLRLMGEETVKMSGASVSPFLGSSLERLPEPERDDPERWRAYVAQCLEQIFSRTDYADNDLGVHLLSNRTRIRPPQIRGLTWLIANRDPVIAVDGKPFIIRNSHVSGLTPDELNACVVGSRAGLARVVQQWDQLMQGAVGRLGSPEIHVLARARRAEFPGVVFARAAAIGERDPLTDIDSQIFVGVQSDR